MNGRTLVAGLIVPEFNSPKSIFEITSLTDINIHIQCFSFTIRLYRVWQLAISTISLNVNKQLISCIHGSSYLVFHYIFNKMATPVIANTIRSARGKDMLVIKE